MIHYEVVFDVVQGGYRYWWVPVIGVVLAAVGALWIAWRRRSPPVNRSAWARLKPYALTGFGALWATATFLGTYGEYRKLRNAIASGSYAIVEGTVNNFVPLPVNRKGFEHFEVAGHRYDYSDNFLVAGFNNMQSHGGPIREGLRVRITDVDGQIARLEIAR